MGYTVFPNDIGLFQQANASCHTAKIVQEWSEEHDKSSRLPNSPDLNLIEYLWDVLNKQSLIHGGPTSQLKGLKGSAADILVPDTTAHLQKSCGVHTSRGQSCFGST
ncbi:hypothetical protein QTP70_031116, partial [Hemibagrus guttatus]